MSFPYTFHFNKLLTSDSEARYKTYLRLLEATDKPVYWSYEVWDQLVLWLKDKDNHKRAIAGQLLANLAKSDPDNRMAKDIDAIFAVTYDERFVTARHTLKAFWKIGLVNKEMRENVMQKLEKRFKDASSEKNCTLIRYDIIVDCNQLFVATQDMGIKVRAQNLIKLEKDGAYLKKYEKALRG